MSCPYHELRHKKKNQRTEGKVAGADRRITVGAVQIVRIDIINDA